ncbi:cytochrome P450 [Lyophyllum atratum]|nr:cytochrome P450 [Lyophyllum atratum]
MALPVAAVAFSLVALTSLKKRLSRNPISLPPGPPADPIIGHLRVIPSDGQDIYFYELSKQYGDVVHLKVLGQTLIVLNSVQAAVDLLNKRSYNYSDRPTLPIFELFGLGDTVAIAKYGHEFRMQRSIVQRYLSKDKCHKDYRPIQTREAHALAKGLLSKPDDRLNLLLRFATAIIIDIGYGHQITSAADDPYVKMAQESSSALAASGPPGSTPVDLFPILQYLPSWCPGTYYATFARNAFGKFKTLREYPFTRVMEQMANGTAKPSFLASQLQGLSDEEQSDEATLKRIQAAAAILYVAGGETTSSSLSFFFLAMILFPECQRKAQEEIDSVVGTDRLPEFHDRASLPCIECLLQETLRWNHATPSGVPHKTMEDDVYNGMLIPKGSTVIANARSMTLDESVYKNPFDFEPSRYLPAPAGRSEPYPNGHFGFGRRICPGRHLATDSIWIAITTIIATISVRRAIGEDGKEMIPDAIPVAGGLTSHPKPFPCRLEPRTDAAVNLLGQAVEESRWSRS